MKTIHSEDLNRMSLQKGASIMSEGRQINASKHQQDMPRPALRPVPSAPVIAPRADPMVAVAETLAAGQRAQQELVGQISTLIRQQREMTPAGAAPIKAWDFVVEYDDSIPIKRMTRVRATAIR